MSATPHIGSSFADLLREEGLYEDVTAQAIKRVLAWQIEQAMQHLKWLEPATIHDRMTNHHLIYEYSRGNDTRCCRACGNAAAYRMAMKLLPNETCSDGSAWKRK